MKRDNGSFWWTRRVIRALRTENQELRDRLNAQTIATAGQLARVVELQDSLTAERANPPRRYIAGLEVIYDDGRREQVPWTGGHR